MAKKAAYKTKLRYEVAFELPRRSVNKTELANAIRAGVINNLAGSLLEIDEARVSLVKCEVVTEYK